MKIKLNKGKPKEDGLYLLQIQNELKLAYIEDNWYSPYPAKGKNVHLDYLCCYGWKKIEVELN